MDENPYQAPRADTVTGVNSGTVADLRNVARYQRAIMICILVYIMAGIAQALVTPALPEEWRLVVVIAVGLCLLATVATATVFVFLLAMNVYSTGLGVVLGILTMMPCVGLIVLLVVNAKATKVLRQNGIRVGLLGAKLSQI